MCDTNGSGVDQNNKLPSFWPMFQEMLILHENLEFLMAKETFPLKRAIFDQWVKKMAIFCFENARANGNIFRVKKSHISLRSVFLGHPVLPLNQDQLHLKIGKKFKAYILDNNPKNKNY